MQFKSSLLALITGSVLFSTGATAEGSYASIGLSSMTYSEDMFDAVNLDDYSPLTLDFSIGQQLNEHLGLEFRLGVGLNEETQSTRVNGVSVDASFQLDNYWGLYVVPALPVGESGSLYANLGFADVEATAEVENKNNGMKVEGSGEEDGFSWALGYRHDLGSNGFQIEYGSVVVSDEFDLTGISAKYFFEF